MNSQKRNQIVGVFCIIYGLLLLLSPVVYAILEESLTLLDYNLDTYFFRSQPSAFIIPLVRLLFTIAGILIIKKKKYGKLFLIITCVIYMLIVCELELVGKVLSQNEFINQRLSEGRSLDSMYQYSINTIVWMNFIWIKESLLYCLLLMLMIELPTKFQNNTTSVVLDELRTESHGNNSFYKVLSVTSISYGLLYLIVNLWHEDFSKFDSFFQPNISSHFFSYYRYPYVLIGVHLLFIIIGVILWHKQSKIIRWSLAILFFFLLMLNVDYDITFSTEILDIEKGIHEHDYVASLLSKRHLNIMFVWHILKENALNVLMIVLLILNLKRR